MKPIYPILFCCLLTSITQAQTIQAEILLTHNQLRAEHQAPQLIWDDTLAQYAQNHAKQCHFKHSSSPYGENLAAGYLSAAAAIQAWYAEGQLYSYNHPGYANEYGHFSQLVWVSSKKIGCAYVSCDGRHGTPGNFLVCEYSPAGNVTNAGYFQKNVLPTVVPRLDRGI